MGRGRNAGLARAAGRVLVLAVSVIAAAIWIDRARAQAPASAGSHAPVASTIQPPAGAGAYWGAYIAGAPWNYSALDRFTVGLGRRPSIVHFWQFWSVDGRLQPFHPEPLAAISETGAMPMVTWTTENLGTGSAPAGLRTGDIVAGRADNYIRAWAVAARNWGRPFFLRFDHEMNMGPGGTPFPWGAGVNGNHIGDYTAAWRHIHDIFGEAGASNATWVWCPNVEFYGSKWNSFARFYPGDQYVDWTCLDGYNWGAGHPQTGGWMSFASVFNYSYQEMLALAPDKPIMIGEFGSTEKGGSKAGWIADALAILPRQFPKVRAVLWYDGRADGMDWPLDSSPAALDAFRSGLGKKYYLSAPRPALN